MIYYVRHASGESLYAKPLPLSSSPSWGDDVLPLSENGSTGSYSIDLDGDTPHEVFVRDGETPASSDAPIAAIVPDAAATVELAPEDIDSIATAVAAAVGDGGGGPAGPDVRTLQIIAHTGDDPETGDPVSGLQVRIAGRTITTDTAGAAEVRLNPGEYVAPAIEPVGFEPLAPLEITIGSDDVVLPVALTRTAIADPDDPALCNVAVDVITQHGRRPDDAIVWAVPADKLPFAVDSLVVTDAVIYTTNSSGRAVVPLLQGEAVRIAVKFGSVEKVIDFDVPNQPTAKATVRV